MKTKNINRKARFFFAARSKKNLFGVEDMKELEKSLADFTFIPVLSRPLPEDNWTGKSGSILKAVPENIGPVDNLEAYLCGSPRLIDGCVAALTSMGMPEELIYYDKFA